MTRSRLSRETKLVAALAGLVIIVGGSAAALSEDVSGVRAAASESVTALIGGRSPGKRSDAKLTKTKRALLRAPNPRSMVLARTTRKPLMIIPNGLGAPMKKIASASSPESAVLPPIIGSPEVIEALPMPAGPPASSEVIGGFTAPAAGMGGGGVVAPPGVGGGAVLPVAGSVVPPVGGGVRTDVVTPPALVSAVPEPETWATMIIGFGAIGWSLRRRRKRASGPSLRAQPSLV